MAESVRSAADITNARADVDVVLATPNRYTADLFAQLLDGHAYLRAAGWARTSEEVARLIEGSREAIVLVDTALADGQGLCRRGASALAGRVRFVALGLDETPPEVVRWLQAGACAYIAAERGVDELVEHLGEVSCARQHAAPHVVGAVFEHFARLHHAGASERERAPERTPARLLTSRELEIARGLAAGKSNKVIAREFGISVATTKSHVHSILRKLALANRRDLAKVFAGDLNL